MNKRRPGRPRKFEGRLSKAVFTRISEDEYQNLESFVTEHSFDNVAAAIRHLINKGIME